MSTRHKAARPKRAGEAFARTHHGDDEGPSSKKARFDIRNPSALAPDAPEEDAILELDEIGKGGQQTKRGAVNLDGYGSDSSNDGFDARAERKAEATRQNAETKEQSEQEEEDIFADMGEVDENSEAEKASTKKDKQAPGKKKIRFMEVDKIEGEVFESKSGGHVVLDLTSGGAGPNRKKGKARAYESSSESDDDNVVVGGGDGEADPENEELDAEVGAGGKKSNAPRLSAFNMREEYEEGRFDMDGNFVRKAGDPDAVHDTWLEGISKKDRRRAREAEEKRAEEQRQRTLANDQVLTSDAVGTLISRLEKGETVLEALARLGKGMEKKRPKWQSKKKNRKKIEDGEGAHDNDTKANDDSGNMDVDDATAQAKDKQRAELEAVTEAADLLLTRGQTNIYEDTREALTRQYRRETGDDWVDEVNNGASDPDLAGSIDDTNGHGSSSSATAQWEYRWADGRDGAQVHGPFDGPTMLAWKDAGFFQEGVEFHRIGEEQDWSRLMDFR